MKRVTFPFSAIIGQDAIKNSLIWNLINPKIGGVLISGEKGTAKSTLVRSLAEITDKKIIELPLNTTEDRLIGSIDFETAIQTGKRKFEPGLLYYADNNILYVDEVNLLNDNIVKSLLDTAANGVCTVEREGISYVHNSEFVLIGSMNPEEGKLRPQFLDRFGLYVEAEGDHNIQSRVEIVRRRMEFEADETAFQSKYADEEEYLRDKITSAKEILNEISVTRNALMLAAQLSKDANCAGHRAEIVIIETAKAIIAFEGKYVLERDSIVEAAKYALPHRIRQNPPLPPEIEEQEEDEEIEQEEIEQESSPPPEVDNTNPDETSAENTPDTPDMEETVDETGEPFDVAKWLEDSNHRVKINYGSGRRSLVKTDSAMGRYVKSAPAGNKFTAADFAFDTTLRAAAPYQLQREKHNTAIAIRKSDIQVKKREKRTGNYILFVVDASGSMGAHKRMTAVKGAILSLLNDAYQKRDKVGMIMFKQQTAEIILGMTRSVDLAQKRLDELPTGGKTPLCYGLEMAHNAVRTALLKDKEILPVIVLISDGRATYGRGKTPITDALDSAKLIANDKIKSIVIDAEQDFIKLNLAMKISEAMDADYYKLEELRADTLITAVSMSIS
jgi:Mg-chelatase subunit ChlI